VSKIRYKIENGVTITSGSEEKQNCRATKLKCAEIKSVFAVIPNMLSQLTIFGHPLDERPRSTKNCRADSTPALDSMILPQWVIIVIIISHSDGRLVVAVASAVVVVVVVVVERGLVVLARFEALF